MNVSRIFVRCLSRSSSKLAKEPVIHPGYFKIKEKYRHFQMDNGLLVHQRGGTMDAVLYGTSIMVNAIGLVMIANAFYRMANK